MPPLPFVLRDVLDRGAASFTDELRETRLMDVMPASRFNADSPHMRQPFDYPKHGARPRGLRHLPQPR